MKMKPRTISLWGHQYRVTPELITTPIGDGKKLLKIFPINDRPRFYLLMIDSSTQIGPDFINAELEDKYFEAIESQCGEAYNECAKTVCRWPAADLEGGYSWSDGECEREEVEMLLKKLNS